MMENPLSGSEGPPAGKAAGEPDALEYKRARFVARLPRRYRYSPAHLWISLQEDGTSRVGLTKFGSRMLGEIVDYGFDVVSGAVVTPGQVIGWIEGFKAVSDLFCIAQGRFVGPNPALEEQVTLVNQDPHGAGWLYAVRGEPDATCLSADAYAQLLDGTIDQLLGKG